jgi:hypothetical protein
MRKILDNPILTGLNRALAQLSGLSARRLGNNGFQPLEQPLTKL